MIGKIIHCKTLEIWFTLISTTFELVTINCSVKHQHKNSSVLEGTLPSKISHCQQQRAGLYEFFCWSFTPGNTLKERAFPKFKGPSTSGSHLFQEHLAPWALPYTHLTCSFFVNLILIPYYLCSFDTNYIICRNVEIIVFSPKNRII
jgi:hypothetical protein